jgi:hypothetical protein
MMVIGLSVSGVDSEHGMLGLAILLRPPRLSAMGYSKKLLR